MVGTSSVRDNIL